MKGFKGFDKNLKCKGKQYAIGREEAEETASLCNTGLHFYENPHDLFNFYQPCNGNRFCEIEAYEVSDEKTTDSIRVAKKLTVKKEISVSHICKIAVDIFFGNFGFEAKINSADTNNAGSHAAANADDRGAANAGVCGAANAGIYGAANAGDFGAANSGYYGAANAVDSGEANAGDCGAANAGDNGVANAGDCGAANTGSSGAANAGSSGAANAGDSGAANAGRYGVANAGRYGEASVKESGVAIAATSGTVKGGKGSVLVLVNRDIDGNINDYAVAVVDGRTIKADTWYRLSDGKFEEDAAKNQ
jgi:hypothetical protein